VHEIITRDLVAVIARRPFVFVAVAAAAAAAAAGG
jgi:uncharacterized protein involved in exopolysaccharide biosynthesis